tara:strand:- start:2019 stop:2624 length:606 start_codon:yes stop_codon:yes gene_type:complete
MKDQLDHKIKLCEDAMKNLDKNTRLQSKTRLGYAPWNNRQLEDTDWRITDRGDSSGKNKQADSNYREALYQPGLGFCGVYAISYYTGIRFDIIFNYMRSRFNRGGTWAGSSSIDEVEKTLNHFGFKMKKLPISKANNITVRDFNKDGKYNNEWIWVETRRHWWLYNNGIAVDQTETAPIAKHNRHNKVVLNAYRLIGETAG